MTRDDIKSAEMETDDAQGAKSRPFLGQVLFYFGASLFAGAIGAALMIFNRGDMNGISIGIVAVLLVIGAGMMFAAVRMGDFDPPSLSSSTGRSQLMMLLYVLIGAAVGIYFNAVHTGDILDGTFQLII
mgnify:CR=1 FL=1